MKSKVLFAAIGMALIAPVTVSAPVSAKTYKGDRKDYRYRCKKSDHAVGTVAGGAGGAVAGAAIIGGPIATIAGGVGGALLGRHIDKKEHQKRNRQRGCG